MGLTPETGRDAGAADYLQPISLLATLLGTGMSEEETRELLAIAALVADADGPASWPASGPVSSPSAPLATTSWPIPEHRHSVTAMHDYRSLSVTTTLAPDSDENNPGTPLGHGEQVLLTEIAADETPEASSVPSSPASLEDEALRSHGHQRARHRLQRSFAREMERQFELLYQQYFVRPSSVPERLDPLASRLPLPPRHRPAYQRRADALQTREHIESLTRRVVQSLRNHLRFLRDASRHSPSSAAPEDGGMQDMRWRRHPGGAFAEGPTSRRTAMRAYPRRVASAYISRATELQRPRRMRSRAQRSPALRRIFSTDTVVGADGRRLRYHNTGGNRPSFIRSLSSTAPPTGVRPIGIPTRRWTSAMHDPWTELLFDGDMGYHMMAAHPLLNDDYSDLLARDWNTEEDNGVYTQADMSADEEDTAEQVVIDHGRQFANGLWESLERILAHGEEDQLEFEDLLALSDALGEVRQRGASAHQLESLQKHCLQKNAYGDCSIDGAGELYRCTICLEDYAEKETVCLLPICHHVFHEECVQSWLKLNQACPLCRTVL
ncbi:hypothetical protein THASP1DRAFT_28062 [Thamnocephalis sphaerospora]|uniref:RING-type domain-containing protein n=1 Tax=Thamnocephalis sphaerospora TaxID=78915 RepID=A0A4V1IX83_9FUNG|nr:hypothetical protein THASP1DRAFT_28062 [Thamnocephalis sphaerospora]|eukprot:RKP10159.1 hypothetical protein THASP1DRAFT_28062 [Thamnocephalis sphaerospora]